MRFPPPRAGESEGLAFWQKTNLRPCQVRQGRGDGNRPLARPPFGVTNRADQHKAFRSPDPLGGKVPCQGKP